MAVLKDPAHIASIKEPAEKVQLATVQKNPEYIRHIESPTVKVQHMAIQGNADTDRKSTRLNSSHIEESRMPSSA